MSNEASERLTKPLNKFFILVAAGDGREGSLFPKTNGQEVNLQIVKDSTTLGFVLVVHTLCSIRPSTHPFPSRKFHFIISNWELPSLSITRLADQASILFCPTDHQSHLMETGNNAKRKCWLIIKNQNKALRSDRPLCPFHPFIPFCRKWIKYKATLESPWKIQAIKTD